MMALVDISFTVRKRRTEMGLTPEAMAKLADLPLETINALEAGALKNLEVLKAERVLELIGLQLRVETFEQKRVRVNVTPLVTAAQTASVSYKGSLPPDLLEAALMSGEMSTDFQPHLVALFDEASMSLIARVVDPILVAQGIERAVTWQKAARLAVALNCYRPIWQLMLDGAATQSHCTPAQTGNLPPKNTK